MAKRDKRIGKGVESLKKQIEAHFSKIEQDIKNKNIDRERYHIKEIDKSLLKSLEIKLNILKIKDNSLKIYKNKLEELKRRIDQSK